MVKRVAHAKAPKPRKNAKTEDHPVPDLVVRAPGVPATMDNSPAPVDDDTPAIAPAEPSPVSTPQTPAIPGVTSPAPEGDD